MNQYSKAKDSMHHWLAGAALGALAMYLADPERGRRRRALARDKIISLSARAGNAVGVTSRDLSNRMQGLRAEARHKLSRRNEQISDYLLVERVRSKIGRVVSHPHALKVRAQQGCVILSGAVLASEKPALLSTVRAVPGVHEIDDDIEVHDSADISSLQGEGKIKRMGPAILKDSWPPALRAVAGIGGGVLSLYGLTRRTLSGTMLGMLGMGLVARGMANKPIHALVSSRPLQASPVHLEKTIYIEAAPEQVFDLWSNYENFPNFMSHVQEVRDLGNGRSHWIVHGPAGSVVEWDAELTASKRPELLAWKSNPEATVQNEGRIHFEPAGSGTRVHVQMWYSPPAGTIGDAVASLFNGNPKKQMDNDLLRMKALIESTIPPYDASRAMPQPGQLLH